MRIRVAVRLPVHLTRKSLECHVLFRSRPVGVRTVPVSFRPRSSYLDGSSGNSSTPEGALNHPAEDYRRVLRRARGQCKGFSRC